MTQDQQILLPEKARFPAGKLHYGYLGIEVFVRISDSSGVHGRLDRFSLRSVAPTNESGAAERTAELSGLEVRLWIDGHKVVVKGDCDLYVITGGPIELK